MYFVQGLFVDQLRNSRMMERQGSALAYDKHDLENAEKLATAIRTVLENPRYCFFDEDNKSPCSYAENATKVARLLRSRPFSPRELLSRHVAFVAENGPLHRLSPISSRMSFIQLYYIDALLIAFSILTIFIFILRRLARTLLSGRKRKTE